MDWILLIAVSSVIIGVVKSGGKGEGNFVKAVWKDRRGSKKAESLEFEDFDGFNKFMFLLDDALQTINSDLNQSLILAVLKGKIPFSDLPSKPKLKPILYHVFFLAKGNKRGVFYLPVAETEQGKGWTKAKPRFYSNSEHVMGATLLAIKKGTIVDAWYFWKDYLSLMMSKARSSKS